MTIDELAEEIEYVLFPFVGGVPYRITDACRDALRKVLERNLPKLDRWPTTREEAERLAAMYFVRREQRQRYPVHLDDKESITEDLVTVLLALPWKKPCYQAKPSGGGWQVMDRDGMCHAYFNDPRAELAAKDYVDWLNSRESSK